MEERRRIGQVIGGFLTGKKGIWLVLIAGALGIALILWSEAAPKETKTETAAGFNPAAYAEMLEERLTGVLTEMEGVGACRVMVTLENGAEYVYASEEKTGSDYTSDGERLSQADDAQSSVILIETDQGYEGLLVTELQPTVKGVVVVCEGGGDAAVCERVTAAVSTVLGVTSKRVCVVAGSGE